MTQECSSNTATLWQVENDTNDRLWRFRATEGGSGLCSLNFQLKICSSPDAYEAHEVQEPGGSVPTWSTLRTDGATPGDLAAPYAMDAGDLDGVPSPDRVNSTPVYHDEAVVVYTDDNNNWALRVVDYNAGRGHLLVTAPDPSITTGPTGTTTNGKRYPGDMLLNVGDFDGDGRNEIAWAWQDPTGDFRWTFFRYNVGANGSRSLTMLSWVLGDNHPFTSTANKTLIQGYSSSSTGDFDGDGRDDIAVAFATTTAPSSHSPADEEAVVNLGVWTFNEDLSTRSATVITPTMQYGNLPPAYTQNGAVALSGIRLVAGNLLADQEDGFGPQRSELGIAWEEMHYSSVGVAGGGSQRGYNVTPMFNIYAADTGDCNSTGTTCTTDISPTGTDQQAQALYPTVGAGQTAYRDIGGHLRHPAPVPHRRRLRWHGSDRSALGRADGQRLARVQPEPQRRDLGTAQLLHAAVDHRPVGRGRRHLHPVDDHRHHHRFRFRLRLGAEPSDGVRRLGQVRGPGRPAGHLPRAERQGEPGGGRAARPRRLAGRRVEQCFRHRLLLPPDQDDQRPSLTSSTSNENSWNNSVKEGVDIDASFAVTGPEAIGVQGTAEINQKFSKAWSGLSQSSTNTSNSWSTNAAAQTNQDDAFSLLSR